MFRSHSQTHTIAYLGGALLAVINLIPACAQEAAAPIKGKAWPTNPLEMPTSGACRLTALSPRLLELELVTQKEPDPIPVPAWDFSKEMPPASDFEVFANGQKVEVVKVGFKRRPLYAPLLKRDLRLANWLYLELALPIPDGAKIEVRSTKHFPEGAKFEVALFPSRTSPALHVTNSGFEPNWPKLAFAGYYIGSLGELPLEEGQSFAILDASGKKAFEGKLSLRQDQGWDAKPYQRVMVADFSALTTPGTYRLAVPGLGTSKPFQIGVGAAAMLARTYIQGMYNQRSGFPLELPFTRFVSAPDHIAPAEVPTNELAAVNRHLAGMSAGGNKNYTSPVLADVKSALYPFNRSGKIDVSGGHRDAGDYSVYTVSSAQVISSLCMAADAFPGVSELDNLGIPESGDGKSDILQEAKWEADYLLKMQDDDGGFFFLKYPKERKYEDDVLPENGDPQIVFPKNTVSSAAATACLAQMASSPKVQAQFPEAAAKYKAAALKGWKFIEEAVAKYGRKGAYQKISHYGDIFGDEDEVTWAAVEMFLLTGDQKIHDTWLANFNPNSPDVTRWGWWRLFEGYGGVIRSYALAPETGRAKGKQLNPKLLQACRAEVLTNAQSLADRAKASAYGSSFPIESKKFNAAGWYFSSVNTMDLAAGYVLEKRPEFFDAILTNFGFEWGANPVNVSYITGVGDVRQRDIVSQYAQNDRRVLPQSGVPLGNIVGGFQYIFHYKKELGGLTFPADWDPKAPYAQMDRWGDSFNVSAEFVTANQAAGLAGASFLMGQSAIRAQTWRTAPAKIVGAPEFIKVGDSVTLTLNVPGLDVKQAELVWEARGLEPFKGQTFSYKSTYSGPFWVEVEALWPDGRRVNAAVEFPITPQAGGVATAKTADTVALLSFDDASLSQTVGNWKGAKATDAAQLSAGNLAWMAQPGGKALQLKDSSAIVDFPLPSVPANFTVSGRLYLEKIASGKGGGTVFGIGTPTDSGVLGLSVNKYPKPLFPEFRIGNDIVVSSAEMQKFVQLEMWQQWEFGLQGDRVTLKVDGNIVYDAVAKNPVWLRERMKDSRLSLGRVTGWADDVAVRGVS